MINHYLTRENDHDRRGLVAIGRSFVLPEYVKTAAVNNAAPAPAAAYGDPHNRLYRCDSPAETWLSAAYFAKAASRDPRIEERLRQFSDFWSIAADVDAVLSHTPKTAEAAPIDFAYERDDEKRLPLRTAEEVKAAANWLRHYRNDVPAADRKEIAGRILTKMAACAFPIGDDVEFLQRQACLGGTDPGAVVDMLRTRGHLAGARCPAIKQAAMILADAVAKSPSLVSSHGLDLVAKIDLLDSGLKQAGVSTAGQPAPEDVIFRTTYTKAAALLADAIKWPDGRAAYTSDINKISSDKAEQFLGPDLTKRASIGFNLDAFKLAEVAASTDRATTTAVDNLLASEGVRFLGVRTGLSAEDITALAG